MVIDKKTVLVAEDEFLLRLMAMDMLTDAGFSVLEAEHADAALTHLSDDGTDVHVLFTDIHMPGTMNGLELAHHVRKHFPDIALLVVSGAASPLSHELPTGSHFLPKPYEASHVVASIHTLLGQPRPSA